MDPLKKSILCRNAEDYCIAMDTYFVESFNNVLEIFTANRFHSGPSSIGCALIWHFYIGMKISIVRTRVSGFSSIKPIDINEESAT